MPEGAPSQPAADTSAGQPETGPKGPAAPATAPAADFDPSKLAPEQLAKVLEHPDLWKQPRMVELLNASREYKALKESQEKQSEERLQQEKKFEELAQKKSEQVTHLESQIKTMQLDQALTGALVKESVVDLDAALKLIDRSKLSIGDSGQIEGVSDAIAALKTDRHYLFSSGGGQPSRVGAPAAPGQPSNSGVSKFKRSQLIGPEGSAFYKEHEAEILEAYKKGLVEDDVTPR